MSIQFVKLIWNDLRSIKMLANFRTKSREQNKRMIS